MRVVPGRTFAIGDVHGDLASLELLLSRLPKLTKDDTVVFLGDYVDRGRNSAGVVRHVRAMYDNPAKVVALRGKAALCAWWADAFARLPELAYVPTAITADGERAVMEYVRRVPGEPDLPVAEALDIRNGRIVASRVFHG